MMKDIKYIIKRIIIGVGIAFAIMFIKSNAFALVYTTNTGGLSDNNVGRLTSYSELNLTNTFVGLGHGTLYFNFSLSKQSGGATDIVKVARTVYVQNAGASYICNIGSIDVGNSTYNEQIYSATCPFDTALSGLTKIRIVYNYSNVSSSNTLYTLVLGGLMTFVPEDTQFLPTLNQTTSYISQQLETINGNITTGNNASASINSSIQSQTTSITQAQQQTTNAINSASDRVNNTLTNDNTTEAETTGSGFFSNFNSNSHGVSGLVTAPLRLMQSFTTANCQPLQFTLPFVHNQVTLQCIRPILAENFGSFFVLFQLLSTGVIAYMVMINIFAKVHDLQDPNNDRIEVLSL